MCYNIFDNKNSITEMFYKSYIDINKLREFAKSYFNFKHWNFEGRTKNPRQLAVIIYKNYDNIYDYNLKELSKANSNNKNNNNFINVSEGANPFINKTTTNTTTKKSKSKTKNNSVMENQLTLFDREVIF